MNQRGTSQRRYESVMARRALTRRGGAFYIEYDEDSQAYCIFHTETEGFAYASFSDREEADAVATQMNVILRR